MSKQNAEHSTSILTDRLRAGRALREAVPLEAHAEIEVDESRPDPVELLVAQDETRLAELVPIRHGRMRVSPRQISVKCIRFIDLMPFSP